MRLSLFSGLLLAAALTGSSVMADEDPLRIAVDIPYKPYQYQQPDGTITGFEVELIDAVCKEMHRQCEWVQQGWDGIIPGLIARKYDFIASAMNITKDRAKQVLFSKPYYQVPSVWVGLADEKIDLNSDLAGVPIGVQLGTIQDQYVTRFYPKADIRRYSDSGGVVNDMYSGRLHLVFTAFPLAQDTLLKEDDYVRRGSLVTEPKSIYGPGVGAAFRKRDRKLVEQFNAAMSTVKSNGTFERLHHKYFGD